MSVPSNLKKSIDRAIAAATPLTNCRRRNPTFHEVWDILPKIEFNPAWNNGTGYYDGAASGPNAPALIVGEERASISPMPDNRKIILVGMPTGNMVLFQRYSGDEAGIIVSNVPRRAPEQIKEACRSNLDDKAVRRALRLANDIFQDQQHNWPVKT